MKPLRSLLFVPGNKVAWMEKAPQYGADALILDLEDSVPLADKATARTLVRQALEQLSARGQTLYVRVNALDTGMTGDDLSAIVCAGLSGLLPPKIEMVEDVQQLDTLLAYFERREGLPLRCIDLIPTLETAKGIRNAYDIARASPRVVSIAGGAGKGGDTNRSLGYLWTKEGMETLFIRSKVLLDARAAGIRYPLVASWFDVGDPEGLMADARRNRQLGYAGMLLIHPSHIGPVNRIFTPSAEDVAYYRGLLAAMEEGERQGTAAVTYHGAMVDIAMVKTAQEMLEFAKAVGVQG
ncbi:MAG: CoA ester lyase [Nitrospinae bacterium]|nr:CoA ester lyase [Nitrospinota bacterium]